MRLTTVILMACLVQVSAATFGQRITIERVNAPLDEILREIRKQSGYDIFSRDNAIADQRTSLNVKNSTVEEALSKALSGLHLNFKIENKIISIQKAEEQGFIGKLISRFQQIDISGRVVDEQSKGLPGVTVRAKNSAVSTISGADGLFHLKGLSEDDLIIFSYIGYKTREIRADAREWLVQMELSSSKLDEIQIQAYGITSQRLSTGDIGTLKAEAIEKQPVTNPLQALQGRIVGIEITQQTGMPGSAFRVQIRGQNSIANGSDPLYVVDGVPYTMDLLQTQGQNLLGGSDIGTAGNALNYLNIGEIESIDVLKDADATAIYGSRGANGVILITTKKGKTGPLSVRLNLSGGVSEVAKKMDLLNTQQYLEMRREAFANDKVTPTNSNAYDILLYDSSRNIDWQEKLIGNTAKFSNSQLSLSGGNAANQYYVGAVYNRQTTVFPGDFYDEKKGVNFNINSTSSDSRFTMLLSGSYLINGGRLPGSDLTGFVFLAPNAPDMVNPDGSLNYTNNPTNYVSSLRRSFARSVNNLIGNAVLGYRLLPGLEIKTSLGYTNTQLTETFLMPGTSINPAQLAFLPRSATFTDNKSASWIAEPQVNYSGSYGLHRFSALAGLSFQSSNSTGEILRAYGFTSDNMLLNPQAAPNMEIKNAANSYRYSAGFARLNYNYADKLILNLSGRRDGSSRFGSERRFSNFGAIGSAYIFSEEKLIKESLPWLSFGKLRASYGITGNDQISDYRYMTLYGNYTTNYQDVKGLTLGNLANPELAWEKTNKLEFGLDLGFFHDRLVLSANRYQNRSSNQLVAYPLSSVTGFESIDVNFAAKVENRGWEFSLNSRNISGKDFKWQTSLNVTTRRNELLKFDNLANSSYANFLIVGKPIYIGKYYNYAGVNPATGVYEFYSADGERTASPSPLTDKNYLYDYTPNFSGGLNNALSYKRFDIDFTFQFVKQDGVIQPIQRPGTIAANQLTSVLARWQNPGDIAEVQKFSRTLGSAASNSYTNYQGSSGVVTDASFIRLKNLSLGYSLPEPLLKKIGLRQARVSLQGQNLLTLTGYQGRDPESQGLTTLPPLLTATAGLQVTF